MKKTQHGGPRKGAGVKAKDGAVKLKRYNVSLDSETVAKAKKIGEGELSRGIRLAVKAHQ